MYRIGQPDQRITARRRVVAVGSFLETPTIVFAGVACTGLKRDFLDHDLPYVGYIKVAGDSVETVSPWVAEPLGPDFIQHGGCVDKWIVRRHSIRAAALDIDSQ